jgi:hypothetical protein
MIQFFLTKKSFVLLNNSRQKQHSSFLFSYSFHRKSYPVFIVILHKIDEYDISILIETFSVPNLYFGLEAKYLTFVYVA